MNTLELMILLICVTYVTFTVIKFLVDLRSLVIVLLMMLGDRSKIKRSNEIDSRSWKGYDVETTKAGKLCCDVCGKALTDLSIADDKEISYLMENYTMMYPKAYFCSKECRERFRSVLIENKNKMDARK